MLTDDLLAYVFDGQSHLLTQPMAQWLTSSRRFTAFVGTFRDKIRKKVRTTHDKETLLDLRLELETAYLLLREPKLNLVYEPGQAEKARRPDFAVTFTASVTFMLEVTRLRADTRTTSAGAPEQTRVASERLADTICNKLGQLLPKQSNVLVVGVDAVHPAPSDLRATMILMQQRAERSDPAFLQRYRFRDRASFFSCYHRLSEVILRGSLLQTTEPVTLWANPQAKHPLPGRVRTVLHRSQVI